MGEGTFQKELKHLQDIEIIRGLAQKDETALTAAQLKYGVYCLTIAERIVGSRETAEECVNDAMHHAWQSIPPQPENLKLYLAAITRNLALNRLRAETTIKRGGREVDAVFEELSECIAAKETPESVVSGQQLGEAVRSFLKTLPQRERDIFLRRYFFAEPTQDIAKRFDVRQSNVLMILSRTRKKLKTYLQKEGYQV